MSKLAKLRRSSANPLYRWGLRPLPVDASDHLGGGRLVEIAGGRVYVSTIGTGPPVIALPGFAGTSRTWKLLAGELQNLFTFHLVDFLGYGLSDKPSNADFSPVGQARQIEDLMKTLGLSRCILLSNAASAQPALHAAFRQPRRFQANIMVAPFVAPGLWVRLLLGLAAPPQAKNMISGLFGLRAFVYLANMLGRHRTDTVTGDVVDEQYLPFGTDGYWDALSKSAKYLRPQALVGIMQMVPVPTLVIWGDRDRAGNTERARRVLDDISDHRFKVIADCGHVVQEERAAEAGMLIREYVEELRNRPAPERAGTTSAGKPSQSDAAS
ncbi:MAG: alpha/beta hydrolase [Gammaproteobacteria bacterium]|nr:alpha/beta hydrolase [Gammaproteobacteria bacterium]